MGFTSNSQFIFTETVFFFFEGIETHSRQVLYSHISYVLFFNLN